MKENKLDEIKQRLKLDDLDEVSKKKLFNTFIEAGGEVIEPEYEKKKSLIIKRSGPRIRKTTPVSATERKSASVKNPHAESNTKRPSVSIEESMKSNPVSRWIERFSAKLACMFSGVTNFSATRFKNGFIKIVVEKYQNNLLEIQMILASILHQDGIVKDQIKQKLMSDNTLPYVYELLVRLDSLYNRELFERLSIMQNNINSVEELKNEMIALYRPLFVLKSYQELIKIGAEKALLSEKELRRMNPNITFENYRKIVASVDFIYQKVYPRLFVLIDYFYKRDTAKKPMRFQQYIQMEETDNIGYYSSLWKEEKEFAARKEQLNKDLKPKENKNRDSTSDILHKNESGISLPLNKGLDFIGKHVDFKALLLEYRNKKDLRALFSAKDKVFLTYALLDFYDKEFSFLFNSSKVHFNVIINYGHRMDIKKELSDCYYRLNGVYERVNEYLKVLKEIRKIEKDSYMGYEERSRGLNQFSAQRSQISRKMRKDATALFENFSKTLLFVVTDFQEEKSLLQNPEEPLEFSKKLDGERIANGKKAIEAIEEAYNMAFALHFLLTDGDLGGYSVVLEKGRYLTLPLE